MLRLKVQATVARLNLVVVSGFVEFAPSQCRYCSPHLRSSVRLRESGNLQFGQELLRPGIKLAKARTGRGSTSEIDQHTGS